MTEAVRLVVWDLDETFWKGTVTEGGIQEYVQAHHDAVIELAHRGIMSSICSKNDPEIIRKILLDKGILEYFVFPSISWDTKGQRLASLVDMMQLRAPTVMFLDDNPNNRAEALRSVPGIQVADETFAASMLTDARFKGKDDRDLSRLKQYKILEARHEDKQAVAGNNEEFLRGCDIRVYIEYDVVSNLDRAIELINRTNQLNFTKRRLPEDANEARHLLQEEISDFRRQAGLVRVMDKYGDYGFVGFFETETESRSRERGRADSYLRHYCFSCRTLGMLIEQWLYEHLRRPNLKVVGDVLTDLSISRKIDWVRLVPSIEQSVSTLPELAPEIVLYGGCEANAIAVYLSAYAGKVEVYGNYEANGIFSRINGAILAVSSGSNRSLEFESEARELGLPLHLCAPEIFANRADGTVFIFNCSRDASNSHFYKHKRHGWIIHVEPRPLVGLDIIAVTKDELSRRLQKSWLSEERQAHVKNVCDHIKKNYDLIRPSVEDRYEATRKLIENIPTNSRIIIATDHDEVRVSDTVVKHVPGVTRYTASMRELVARYAYADIVSFSEVIKRHNELQIGGNHYDRSVYLRFAQRVVDVVGGLSAKPSRPIGSAQFGAAPAIGVGEFVRAATWPSGNASDLKDGGAQREPWIEMVLSLRAGESNHGSAFDRVRDALIPSLNTFCDPSFVRRLTIVVPQTDVEAAHVLAAACKISTRILCEDDLIPSGRIGSIPRRDWYVQQLANLAYSRICNSDIYIVLSADAILINPLGKSCLRDGTAPMTAEAGSTHSGWWRESARLLAQTSILDRAPETAFGVAPAFVYCKTATRLIAELDRISVEMGSSDWVSYLAANATASSETWTDMSLYWTHLLATSEIGELYHLAQVYHYTHYGWRAEELLRDPKARRKVLFCVLQSAYVNEFARASFLATLRSSTSLETQDTQP